MTAALFVAAAALGALARGRIISALNVASFPWGTLSVNTSGALLAGVVAGHLDGAAATVLATAALGAFTTFSTFAVEVDAMLDEGRRVPALAYALVTPVLAVGTAAVGLSL
jgi:CrcB protein